MASQREIARILDKLPAEDALALSPLIEAPSATRARRQDARDEALRAAAALLPGSTPCARACALASALTAYTASSAWRLHSDTDTPPADAKPLPKLMHEALRLNGGKPLKWRQLLNITRGARTPFGSAAP
jgi:hypothetical protein